MLSDPRGGAPCFASNCRLTRKGLLATTSLFQVKILQTVAALQGHEGQAALALSTVINGSIDDARLRLAHALPALVQLPARLAQSNHRAANPSSAQGTQ